MSAVEPRPRVAVVDGMPMSSLVTEVPHPRAVIVALHGGGTSSAYFDCPGRPWLSLLRIGAALGFTVLALDRPGHGTSAGYVDMMGTAQRADLMYATVDRILGPRARGAGMFVLAHSIGCELALGMAADDRGVDLLGMEIAGTGRHHHPNAREILKTVDVNSKRRVRDLIWQPAHLYPAEVLAGIPISSAAPGYERDIVTDWTRSTFPALAAQVRVPLRFSFADHEKVWDCGPAAVADIAAMFTAAPRVEVNEQTGSGHNLSLGLTAAAYHLTCLSFVEECVVARENPPAAGQITAGASVDSEAR
jgi:pimeloyl-ACP methyl ester carboxylesterase